ncbi:MAG: hypothetical protein ACI4E4_10070 [Acetatifactor sp.]
MKCEFCYGTLTLEDEYCPCCGKPNAAAKQHIEDMKHYKGEFESTQKYVKEKTGIFSQITVRVVIIAVLIVLIIGALILMNSAWNIVMGMKRSYAEEHHQEFTAIMDRYLEERDYSAYDQFCSANHLRFYDSEHFAKYDKLQLPISYYTAAIDSLQKYREFDPNTFQDYTMRSLMDSLNGFYTRFNKRNDRETWEKDDRTLFLQVIETMEQELRSYLVVYCGFTKEEADSLSELTDARRAVLFEDKWEEKTNEK